MHKEAFYSLIKIGNIGKKDIERLHIILDSLDEEGKITRKEAITLTHSTSSNPARSYNNFINRIKKEIKDTYNEIDNKEYQDMLSSMSIGHSNLMGTSYLVLKGKGIVKLQPTTSQNKIYTQEYYVDTAGDTSREKEIFISYATANEGEKERFVNKLKKVLKKKNINYNLYLWEMKEIPIGISFHDEISRRLNKADYGFVLLSNDVMQSNYILNTELPHLLTHNKVFPIGLVGDIDGLNETIENIKSKEQKETAKSLMARNIQLSLERTFFDKCVNDSRQEEFIESVISSLEHRISFDKNIGTVRLNNVVLNKDGYEGEVFFDEHKGERTQVSLATEKLNQKNTTLSVKIQDDLKQWLANDKKALYALLGDYGMGKTFNLRMISHYLYDMYREDKTNIFPFYIDLRDVESFVTTVDGIKRVRTIEEFITEILRQSKNTHVTADEIIQMHRNNLLILILDGLDEKLVHYNKEEQKTFFREIVSIMTYDKDTQYASKTILSCRNHYFETTTNQNNFLLGADRTNLKSNDYTALNILPLEGEEILEFLKKRLPEEDAERIMLYVHDDEYLGSIASRPFMLGKIIDLLPQLTQLKAQQKSINTATFYEALIKDTLGRDEEKHFIAIRHKYTILKALAYYMFTHNTQSLSVNKLNDWFEDFISDNPRLARKYSIKEDGHILEKDLRNSTLLVRFGDENFGFSHSSIAEYFLAQYILEHYDVASKGKEVGTLTHTMILESIESFSIEKKQKLFPELLYRAQQNDIYWAKLSLELLCELKQPIKLLELHDLNLGNFLFKNFSIEKLLLNNCNLPNSTWKQCHINQLSIKDSNLSDNYFTHTQIKKFKYKNSRTYPITSYKSNINIQSTYDYDSPTKYPFSVLVNTHLSYSVTSIAYSPDGKKLLTGSSDNTLRLWNLENGECILTCVGHTNWVNSVAYSPDGKTLLSGSSDNTLRLWDAINGKCLHTFYGHLDRVNSVAYSPDGNTLLSGALDNTLCLWDKKTKKLIQVINGHGSHIRAIAYSPDGKTLLSGSSDKTLRLWDAETAKYIQTSTGHKDWISSVVYSPDGKTLLSGSFDKTLRLWDAKNGKCIHTLHGHDDWVNSVAYSPDGKMIFSASRDKTVRIWDIKSAKCLYIIENFSDALTFISCDKNGKNFITASENGIIKIFDIKTKKPIYQMSNIVNEWYSLDYINKIAKGTPMSWKYVNLENNGEKYYFSDMQGFKVCE